MSIAHVCAGRYCKKTSNMDCSIEVNESYLPRHKQLLQRWQLCWQVSKLTTEHWLWHHCVRTALSEEFDQGKLWFTSKFWASLTLIWGGENTDIFFFHSSTQFFLLVGLNYHVRILCCLLSSEFWLSNQACGKMVRNRNVNYADCWRMLGITFSLGAWETPKADTVSPLSLNFL